MEIFAAGAFVANALSRLRQGYGGPRDNAFHLFRLTAFAFHHFPALGDQKIARFLAKQRNCSRNRMTGRDGALRRPDIAARCPYLRGLRCGLIPGRIKFLLRQLRRRDCTVPIAFPQNGSEASAIGSAKVRHKIVDLWIGNFCRNAIHS